MESIPYSTPANMFTVEELRDLAARASTIDERLGGGYIVRDSPAAAYKAAKCLEMWCKSAADGDDELFQKQLVRKGLDIEAIKPLLGDVCLTKEQPTPNWVRTFEWVIEALRSPGDSSILVQFANPEQPLPFEDLLIPISCGCT